jgi:sucrose phosphorylase
MQFLHKHVGSAISTIHILPCYPSSSDDGFSVIDPFEVDLRLGTWADIEELAHHYHLMLDLVANHLSVSNAWIREFLQENPQFANFAITMKGDEDLKTVFRPRVHPLLTQIMTPTGSKLLWTTFSADQIDLNYHNPYVLLRIIEVLLNYIAHGASIVRLDAIAFIWKELGTACIHHPKTHLIIQYMRWILDTNAPGSLIITETNVPHIDNISYFGDGTNEASLVYNFALPPLVLHTFLSQDASCLSKWISTLSLPSDNVSFFNFLSSHDGIGLVPVRDILSTREIETLSEHVVDQGGFISKKTNEDGSSSPYELNINYFSALKGIAAQESESMHIDRFIAAIAITVCLQGIPGMYIHSLLGSENYLDAPDLETHPRSINREKLDYYALCTELDNPTSRRSHILARCLQLLHIRQKEAAFRTVSSQKVLDSTHKGILALLRISQKPSEAVLCLFNVSARTQMLDTDCLSQQISRELDHHSLSGWQRLLAENRTYAALPNHLAAYEVMLLKCDF